MSLIAFVNHNAKGFILAAVAATVKITLKVR